MLFRVKKMALTMFTVAFFVGVPSFNSAWALDVRIVVELTEAAHTADADGFRSLLIKELVNFLPDDANGSVWGYSGTTLRMVNHGQTDRMWRQVADIHGRHLSVRGRQANPATALRNALFDLESVDRAPIELIWVGTGQVNLGPGGDIGKVRDQLVNEFTPKLKAQRVRIHSLVLPEANDVDRQLMQQVAETSGGLFGQATSKADVSKYAEDLLRLIRAHSEALVDPRGRFQIGPGTERFTAMWQLGADAQLKAPNGTIYGRDRPITNGRWLLAQDYEMATINDPEPGWWEARGDAIKIGVWSELEFLVQGLTSPVVPTDETSAFIQLFSNGEMVTSSAFLDLLDVRAWLVEGGDKEPLPVEREEDGFRAYFVHLDDGAFELEVGVIGPTFAERTVFPFVAKNPMRVDVKSSSDTATAWVSFNHPDIDYRTLKASAKVRKPPQLGVITPGQRMPGGIWQIPLGTQEGILEVTFSISGNYLNGEGFFLKTKPAAVTLPLAEGTSETFKFDAAGVRLDGLAMKQEEPEPIAQFVAPTEQETQAQAQSQVVPDVAPPTQVEAGLSLPLWFVGAISGLNLALFAFLWWFLRPRRLQLPELPVVPIPQAEPA